MLESMSINVLEPGYGKDAVEYMKAWSLQQRIHDEVVSGNVQPTVIMLEHPPTYTAGRRTQDSDRPTDGTPVVDVDRGGLITWHGPGQLVAYPIVPLRDRAAIKSFVWALEEAIIKTVADFGITAQRVEQRAGVWVLKEGVQDEKIAAIGLHIDNGVSMHGLSLNVNNSLAPYDVIVPCGIQDSGVTTMALQAGRNIEVADVVESLSGHLLEELAPVVTTPENESEQQNIKENTQA
ncbi:MULTISPECIES: lipoyl(octanoyl) transferase LipB [Micrococcaceae]|uniref:lipoyl(octanoyl) transferase LipB n=1 Tax=Micrococcaceae TaxID=1268 RepID=UPI000AED6B28|nr:MULTISPECIES: lipoyl(octanoyl) transferase LipB [Micrococcaceae]